MTTAKSVVKLEIDESGAIDKMSPKHSGADYGATVPGLCGTLPESSSSMLP
jgi:hypothetical protein